MIPAQDEKVDFSDIYPTLPSYPLFVKPATEGSSKGIDNCNKVNEPAGLEPAIREIQSKVPSQDILVESFLSGREFTVSILGTGRHSRVIGIREHLWCTTTPNHQKTNGFHSNPSQDFACRLSKSSNGGRTLMYNDSHDMADPQIKETCRVALDTWKVFNCRDCGRVDIRFDSDKPGAVPNVLEVSIIYIP